MGHGESDLAVEALIDDQHPIKKEAAAWAREHLCDQRLFERDRQSEFWADGHQRIAEQGIFALNAPTEFGGQGASITTALLTLEGVGLGCEDNGLVFAAGSQIWSTQNALQRYGSPAQKERYLAGLLRGERHAAFCMSEPDAGSDAFSLTTRAVPSDVGYVLTGKKCWSTFAPIADFFLVFASTDPDVGQWGISAFLVDADTPGVSASANQEKMGYRTVPFGDVILDECEIPAENLLGSIGAGAAMFSAVLNDERAFLFASELGAMERTIDTTVAFAREREQFGRSIGSFQAVSHRIAEMKLRHETARLLMYKAAMLAERKQSVALASALAKMHTTEGAVTGALDAMRVHGARGYVTEHGVERQLRDALGSLFTSGTSDVQRNIVATLMGVG